MTTVLDVAKTFQNELRSMQRDAMKMAHDQHFRTENPEAWSIALFTHEFSQISDMETKNTLVPAERTRDSATRARLLAESERMADFARNLPNRRFERVVGHIEGTGRSYLPGSAPIEHNDEYIRNNRPRDLQPPPSLPSGSSTEESTATPAEGPTSAARRLTTRSEDDIARNRRDFFHTILDQTATNGRFGDALFGSMFPTNDHDSFPPMFTSSDRDSFAPMLNSIAMVTGTFIPPFPREPPVATEEEEHSRDLPSEEESSDADDTEEDDDNNDEHQDAADEALHSAAVEVTSRGIAQGSWEQLKTYLMERTKASTDDETKITERQKELDDAFCLIDQTEFEKNEQVCALPCGHLFHKAAIDRWLSKKGICPVCRTNPQLLFLRQKRAEREKRREKLKEKTRTMGTERTPAPASE